ncbi:hypothetical protein ACQ86D_28210 [Streptomyces galilaeus]
MESRIRINAALTVFDQLRAAPWTERTRTELGATGTSRRPPGSTDTPLTRTVSGHLYNVFRKVGGTARGAVDLRLTHCLT